MEDDDLHSWWYRQAAWITALGMLTLFGLLAPSGLSVDQSTSKSVLVSLNGEWDFSIHGHGHKKVLVPSTYLPVGGATLERNFEYSKTESEERLLLRFEGIVMTGKVSVNSHEVGEYGPYTPFTIDVTDQVVPGTNRLRIDLTDLGGFEPWGREWVTAFPRYGGIIRDVNLELKSPIYVENVRLDYKLSQEWTRTDCQLQVWITNTSKQPANIELSGTLADSSQSHSFKVPFQAAPGKSRHTVQFTLEGIKLWSPDSPHLYNLSLSLSRDELDLDRFATLTGFKELVARGRDFFLNGKKFFIKGIFRHDIYGDQGHTLTRPQMETEIRDIKSLGCNFIRLGHYPHHGYITELAARYGLLTSGEPPVFGLNQKDPKVVQAAQFCLGGLIRRDWNNPAMAFWLISNESGTDPDYMKEMVSFVRGLDPHRLVSIVDNTRLNEENVPWKHFRDAGIDFICQNAYGSAFDGYYEKLENLLPDDLPFVISEWGGTSNSYSQVLREGRYYLNHSNLILEKGPRLAGVSFWEYQDIPMRRWTEEGLLHWSLVDVFRQPYETYYAVKSLYTGETLLPVRGRLLVPPIPEQLPRPLAPERVERYSGYEPLDLSSVVNSTRVISALKALSSLAYPQHLETGKVVVAGLPFVLEPQLVALSRETSAIRIPLNKAVSELEFLGHVCFNSLAKTSPPSPPELPYLTEGYPTTEIPAPFKGYPQAGEFGEAIGEYVLVYGDGNREIIPLENGIHFADYRLFYGFSPIDAVATATDRVLTYKGDYGAKTYQMRLFSYKPKRPETRIAELQFNLKNFDYVPLLAAITTRTYEPE
jgi:hypothetical protein